MSKLFTQKIRFKSLSNRQVLRSWIISYSIILILPLLLNLIVYIQAYSTIRKQANDSQEATVEKLRSDLDNEFSRISEFISKISVDVNINYFLNATTLTDFTLNYKSAERIQEINDTLQTYEPFDSLISDYYIFSSHGMVWHNHGVNDLASYGQLDNNYSNLIEKKCSGLDMSKVNIFTITPYDASSYTVITYPLPYTYIAKGYIAILLNNTSLGTAMGELAYLNNSGLHMTDTGYSLLSSSQNLSDRSVFQKYDLTTGSVSVTFQGEKTLLYTLPSAVLDINYICSLPLSAANQSLRYLRNSLLISIICCILGGGTFIIYLAKRNYSPIQKLLNTIKEHSNTSSEQCSNEYQLVVNAFQDIYKEKATVEQVVHSQNKTLYSYYLSQLLKGKPSLLESETPIITELEEKILLQNYMVLLTLTDLKNEWVEEHIAIAQSAYMSFFETQITQKLQEQLGDDYVITTTEMNDFTACIIGIKEDKSHDWENIVESCLTSILDTLKTDYEFQYYLALSNLHTSVSEMSIAYKEAYNAISYSIMNHYRGIVFYKNVFHMPVEHNTNQELIEKHLFSAIQTANEEEAMQLLNQLLDQIAKGYKTFDIAKCSASSTLFSLFTLLSQIPEMERDTFKAEFYEAAERFMQSTSFESLRSRFTRPVQMLCRKLKETTADKTPQNIWIAKIEEQLEQNLCNENLNVMFLANQLGISSKYMSYLYFEAKGVSLIDTIHKRRISLFKKLIQEDNKSINEAANEVGYNSIATLNRWIKKYEGTTPGQLKKPNN